MNSKPKLSPFSDLVGKTIDIFTGNWKFLIKVSLLLLLTNGAMASLNFASQLQNLTSSSEDLNWNLNEKTTKHIVMGGIPIFGNVLGMQKQLAEIEETIDPYGRFEGQEEFGASTSAKTKDEIDKGKLAAILGIGMIVILIVLIPLIIAGIIIGTWGQTTALEGVIAKVWGREVRAGDCYKNGFRKIWGFITTGFLYGLVVFFGFVLLIIPGILFAFWYSLAPYVFLVEGKRGFSAMKRSKEIITGRILGYTGRNILFALLSGVILIPIMGILVGLTSATSGVEVFGGLLAFALGLITVLASGTISIAGMIFNMLMIKELIETTPEMVQVTEGDS